MSNTISNVTTPSTFSLSSTLPSSSSSSLSSTKTTTSLVSSMTTIIRNDNDYQSNMNGTNTSNNINNNNNGYESSNINNNSNNNSNTNTNNINANNTKNETSTTDFLTMTNAGGDSVNATTSSNATTTSNNNTAASSNNENSNNNPQDDVCRDFLRNVCRRGKSCRYKHPDINDSEMMKNKEPYVFCHDFQNRECRRDNCRFLHCTKQEEEMYRSTGKLPPHIQGQFLSDERNVAPVCKDFLNNTCRRGPRCKYRHPLPPNEFHPYGHHHHQQPLHHSSQSNSSGRVGNQFNGRVGNYSNSHIADYSMHYSRAGSNSGNMMPSNYGSYDGYADSPQNKRKRYDSQSSMYHLENNGPYPGGYQEPPPSGNVRNSYGGGNSMHDAPYASGGASGYPNSQPPRSQQPPAIDSSRSYLEEENAALRRRIEDLKKQVQDLLSTNEYLMEQMNQIRASGQAAVAAACAPHGATTVASLQPQPTGSVQTTAPIGMSAPLTLQAPAQAAVAIGPLPPVSIVSSIASISLPTVSAPVTLVPNSSAAAYTPSMATMHSSSPWPLGVDQLLKNDL